MQRGKQVSFATVVTTVSLITFFVMKAVTNGAVIVLSLVLLGTDIPAGEE
jgi:hypothetical protein